MQENYVIYHCHSDLSNLTAGTGADSVTKYIEYVKLAKENNMTALGISEHGSVINWIEKKRAIEKAGMKYIHSSEVYLTKSIEGKLVRDNYHLIMIAKNYDGVKELNSLLSTANLYETGNFYYNPRITFDQLKNTSDNIIITTACLGSPIWQLYKKSQMPVKCNEDEKIANESKKDLNELLEWMAENRHRVFLEIQYHNYNEQIEYNRLLLRLSNHYKIPLIAGTDTHSKDKYHAEARKILLSAKKASYGDEDSFDLTFKTYDELIEMFEKQNALLPNTYLTAIENTNVLADMIEEFTTDKTPKYPKLYDNPIELFRKKINEGIIKKGIDKFPTEKRRVYEERIEEEFDVYIKLNTVDYMLLQRNIVEWCQENDIKFGFGRGSVSGSLIAYILEITEMDSIKHNLIFSRFLNADRVSLPDIDTDYPPSRRQEVIDYVASLKGVDFAEIITLNTLALRGSVREVCRGLDVDADEIINSIETYNGKDTVPSAIKEKYENVFKYADILNGIVISMGSHPSGFVLSPINLDENVSTIYTKESKYKVTAVNMKELDEENYVKLDLLGLANIELINETCKLAGIERLTPDNIDVNDMNVWKSLRESTLGVFQMESDLASNYLKKLFSEDTLSRISSTIDDVDYMSLLSMANGAIRPSGKSYRDLLAEGVVKDNHHKALNDFLKPTLGNLIFQEQISQFLMDFCEHSGSEADSVRRGLAKKEGTSQFLPKIEQGFIHYMISHYKESEENAKEILQSFLKVISDASDYGFSINHSQPYSYTGYIGAYLRYHYPLEFLTAVLNVMKDEKASRIMEFAKSKKYKIMPISFGKSRATYELKRDENAIYKGIASIKFLNAQVSEELFELAKNKHYNENEVVPLFVDIIEKTTTTTAQMEILIRLDFFKKFGSKEILLEIYQTMMNKKSPNLILYPEFDDRIIKVKKRKRNKETKKMEEIEVEKVIKTPLKYDKTHKENTKEVRISNLKKYELAVKNNPPRKIELHEQIMFEKENLGYIESIYHNVPNNVALVLDINTKYKPVLTLYKLKTGEEIRIKVDKKLFWANDPYPMLYIGDVIKILEVDNRWAWKLIDGKWEEDKTRRDLHLKKCSLLKGSNRRKSE